MNLLDRAVTYNEIDAAYVVMFEALQTTDPRNTRCTTGQTRSYLMKYLDGIPLPVNAGHGSAIRIYNMIWDTISISTGHKLDALLGPHGYAIAKAFIIRMDE